MRVTDDMVTQDSEAEFAAQLRDRDFHATSKRGDRTTIVQDDDAEKLGQLLAGGGGRVVVRILVPCH